MKICDSSVLTATHDEAATLLTARDTSVTLVVSRETSCEPDRQKEKVASPPQPIVPSLLLSTAQPNDVRVGGGGSTPVATGDVTDAVSSSTGFRDNSNKHLDAQTLSDSRKVEAVASFEASPVPAAAVRTNNNNILFSKDALLIAPASVVATATVTQSPSLIPGIGGAPPIVALSVSTSSTPSSGVDSLFANLEKLSPSDGVAARAQPASASPRFPQFSPTRMAVKTTTADEKRKDSVSNWFLLLALMFFRNGYQIDAV